MFCNRNYNSYVDSDDIIKKLLVLHGHLYSEKQDKCTIQIEVIDDCITENYQSYLLINRYGYMYSKSVEDNYEIIPHIDIITKKDEESEDFLSTRNKINIEGIDGEIYDFGFRSYVIYVENELTNRVGFYCKLLLLLLNNNPSKKFKDINIKYKQMLENENITLENINNLMDEFSDIFIDYDYLTNTLKNSILRVKTRIDGNDVFEEYHKYLYYVRLLKDNIINAENKVTELKNHILTINTETEFNVGEFVDIIKHIPDIKILSVNGRGICFLIDTFLRVYSKQDLLILLKNKNSYFYSSLRDKVDCNTASKIFKAIFFDKKYKIRFTQGIELPWDTLQLRNYEMYGITNRRLFNPHITYYNCFSEVKNESLKALQDGDFNKFFGQLLAGVQSITVTDSVVMSRFIHDFMYAGVTNKAFYDVENKCYINFDDVIEKCKDLPEPDWDNLEANDVSKENL